MPGPQPPRRPPRRGWLIAASAGVLLVLLIAALAAVTGDDDQAPAAAKSSPAAKPSPSSSRETWEYLPAEQRKAFLAYLHQLDPGLTPESTGARPRPLRRAVSVCWDIYDGKPVATVLHNSTYRYNGGMASVPEGSEKARKILAAVKRWVCSSKELRAVYDARHP
ncbi:hypothetical protein ACFQY7_17830 [Actinomadura luteofluorescens]|uniref:Uncharacterized protein n=1 Tax=Actinomadura luteofluorescens TaxID=46163 RepID=A0A7Y9JJS0_9ACTN|nr:hypothetical protein [Actinomadura luteofluorescens]NYD51757.1 hypothetical protein [Actinomadura luteofluorescens]